MASACSISIAISYRRRGETEWREVILDPNDYFWKDPDAPDGIWEVDSVARHTETFSYLAEKPSEIEFLRHVAENPKTGARQFRFYHHWANGQSYSCYVQTKIPSEESRKELIVSNALPFKENCSEVLRFDLATDEPQLLLNIIMHGAGGDEHSINVFPPKH